MWIVRKFCFVALFCSLSTLVGENLDTPFISIEADAVGVVFPARTGLSLLYNSQNNYIAVHSRSLNPYYTGCARASIKLSPDDYQTVNVWFLGPIHLLYRLQLQRITNDFREYTTPYTTTNWSQFYYYKFKDSTVIYQGGALYEYHFSPEYKNYFSFTVMGGVKLIYFDDTYNSWSIAGGNVNKMNIAMENDIIGPQAGFRFLGRVTTRFTWNVDILGGIYGNWAQKDLFLEDLGGQLVTDNTFNQVKLSGSFDAELSARYRVNHFSLNMTAFYGKFLGFASAVAQLGQSKSLNKIANSESIPYGGIRVGLEVSW